jgi:hypothetical protein
VRHERGKVELARRATERKGYAEEVHPMPATDRSPRRCSEPGPYEIRVLGHLDARWAGWLDGLTLAHAHDGTTTLRSPPLDQAALHGLLGRIRDLGVPLVSMRRVCPDSPNCEDGYATEHKEAGPA